MPKSIIAFIMLAFSVVAIAGTPTDQLPPGTENVWVFETERGMVTTYEYGILDSQMPNVTVEGNLHLFENRLVVEGMVCSDMMEDCIWTDISRKFVSMNDDKTVVVVVDDEDNMSELHVLNLDPLIVTYAVDEWYGNSITLVFKHVGDFLFDKNTGRILR